MLPRHLALLAGLVSTPFAALASPTLTDTRIADAPPPAPAIERFPEHSPIRIDVAGAWGSLSRGGSGADGVMPVTYSNAFESLALEPTPLNGQAMGGVWGGGAAGHVDLSTLSVPASGPGDVFAVNDPLAGNTSTKIRARVVSIQPPDRFYTGYSYNFSSAPPLNPPPIPPRTLVAPTASQPSMLASDAYITSLATLWTHEAVNVPSGFIVDRLLWGGTNSLLQNGLPTGSIPHFYNLTLDPNSFTTGVFRALRFPVGYSGPHTPGPNGEMSPPINAWFRITHQGNIDGTISILIDYNDGQGPILGFHAIAITAPKFDRHAVRGSYQATGSLYVDNLQLQGAVMILPTPPPLECTLGEYVDDLEWLNPGPLFGQSTRWIDRLSAKAFVTPDGAQGKVLRQVNMFPDNHFRRENKTSLPLTYATPGNPLSICTKINIPAGNATVRALAPETLTENSIVSRLFIGRETPSTPYTNAAYVQINQAYDPVDEAGSPNPLVNAPVIGTDVVATGLHWPLDDLYRNVCFNVTQSRAMTITVSGVTIYTGSAFVSGIDGLWYESENNAAGAGNPMSWDDIRLQCTSLIWCPTPFFALVYHDDLEWGIVGATIGQLDDDGNSATPFRWASAPNMPIQQGAGSNATKVLRMENLFRDQLPLLPSDPNFLAFTQASTRLPQVITSSSRGWATRGSYMLTDAATTRLWSPGAQTSQSGVFALCTRIAFSSVTQTLWHTTPNPAFVCPPIPGVPAALWTDTGVSLASLSINHGDFFMLSIHKNLAGNHTFRINGRVLRDSSGAPVTPASLARCEGASLTTNANLDIVYFSSGDDNTAGPGSILYLDNIRAWALPCLGDTNDDGVVTFNDLNNVLSFFGQSGPDIPGNIAPDADNNGVPDDNITNFADLNAVLSGFGVPCA